MNMLSTNTQMHLESVAKSITVCAAVYIGMRWARRSGPDHDSYLVALGAIVAVVLGF